jgi:hypothetical protein
MSGLVSTIPRLVEVLSPAFEAKVHQVVLTGVMRSCDAPAVAYWYEPLGGRPGHHPLTDIAGGRE